MSLPPVLKNRLSIPVVGAPLFIVSGPELVIAQCKAGIVGSFPALNARPAEMLDKWIERIKNELDDHEQKTGKQAAPFAVNQIVHVSNDRVAQDMQVCVKHKVPIIITSLRAPGRDREGGARLRRRRLPRRHQHPPREEGGGGGRRRPDPRLRRRRRPRGHAVALRARARSALVVRQDDPALRLDRQRRERAWPRRRWAPTSPISAPASSRRPKRTPIRATSRCWSTRSRTTSSTRTSSPACTATTWGRRSPPPASIPSPCPKPTSRR